jgi:hypothetical protein
MKMMMLEQQNHKRNMMAQQGPNTQPQPMQMMQQMVQPQAQRTEAPTGNQGGLFGTSNRSGFGPLNQTGGLFGSANNNAISAPQPPQPPQAPTTAAVAFGKINEQGISGIAPENVLDDFDFDGFLRDEEAEVEETGMTTTYDLRGTKTLAPSSNATKKRVARMVLANVAFSHTVVAKYRPAAFLKAKVRNASKLSLLRGPVGLTLDGTFLGSSTLPRCTSGDSFTMSLGVDPTIRVVYPKPDVKRSTTGVFSSQNSTGYRRSVTITNTRGASFSSTSTADDGERAAGSKPVRLIVLDQVPVSEDDKLRVDIAHPRGLSEGAGISTGPKDGTSSGSSKDWGKAVATLKKGGEVSWDVSLYPGKTVRLDLEYEVSLPAGDRAVQSTDNDMSKF